MFVSWENGKPLNLRYQILDQSVGILNSVKTSFGIVDNTAAWNSNVLETENNTISETCGTCILLQGKTGLTKLLTFIFSTVYCHDFNFLDLMAKLKSLQQCNKYESHVLIETSKYIDLRVTLGRYLSAPL